MALKRTEKYLSKVPAKTFWVAGNIIRTRPELHPSSEKKFTSPEKKKFFNRLSKTTGIQKEELEVAHQLIHSNKSCREIASDSPLSENQVRSINDKIHQYYTIQLAKKHYLSVNEVKEIYKSILLGNSFENISRKTDLSVPAIKEMVKLITLEKENMPKFGTRGGSNTKKAIELLSKTKAPISAIARKLGMAESTVTRISADYHLREKPKKNPVPEIAEFFRKMPFVKGEKRKRLVESIAKKYDLEPKIVGTVYLLVYPRSFSQKDIANIHGLKEMDVTRLKWRIEGRKEPSPPYFKVVPIIANFFKESPFVSGKERDELVKSIVEKYGLKEKIVQAVYYLVREKDNLTQREIANLCGLNDMRVNVLNKILEGKKKVKKSYFKFVPVIANFFKESPFVFGELRDKLVGSVAEKYGLGKEVVNAVYSLVHEKNLNYNEIASRCKLTSIQILYLKRTIEGKTAKKK